MNSNEMLGAVLGAFMTLAIAFYFFHDRISKDKELKFQKELAYERQQNEYREKQLQATLETNHQLKMMNEQIARIGRSDEKQNEVLELHAGDIDCLKKENSDHERRIKQVEDTVFKKHRVD